MCSERLVHQELEKNPKGFFELRHVEEPMVLLLTDHLMKVADSSDSKKFSLQKFCTGKIPVNHFPKKTSVSRTTPCNQFRQLTHLSRPPEPGIFPHLHGS